MGHVVGHSNVSESVTYIFTYKVVRITHRPMASLRMARKNERHRSGGKRSPKAIAAKTILDDLPAGGLLSDPKEDEPWQKPKKLSKRQAKRLEHEAAQNKIADSSSSRKTKGPSSPDTSEGTSKLGRSGNIAYGGHGEEWKKTPYAKRISNNHMLRIKREQAARLRQLEAQENPASLLSGKAKKAAIKEKRILKKLKKLERQAKEEKEAEDSAKAAQLISAANNVAFKKQQQLDSLKPETYTLISAANNAAFEKQQQLKNSLKPDTYTRKMTYGQGLYMKKHWLASQRRKNEELNIEISIPMTCGSPASVVINSNEQLKWDRIVDKALKNIVEQDLGCMDATLLLPAIKESKNGVHDLSTIALDLKVCVLFFTNKHVAEQFEVGGGVVGASTTLVAPETESKSSAVSDATKTLYRPEHVFLVGAAKKLDKKCGDLRNLLTHYHWRLSGRDISFEEMVAKQ